MRHGHGTWKLRPFNPTPETENFVPITILEGEWKNGWFRGKRKYRCLPMYKSDRHDRKHWYKFKDDNKVRGGVLECDTFVRGKPDGRVKCTFVLTMRANFGLPWDFSRLLEAQSACGELRR